MKLPRTKEAFHVAISDAYNRGLIQGVQQQKLKMEAEITKLKDTANLKALEQVTNLARATGQAIEAITRAMYDGRGY